jgi:ribulose-phosphate 3-epimerase
VAIICPTVLATDAHDFRLQVERIKPFAKRLQIDLTDGTLTSSKTVGLSHIWWPQGVKADLHLMYRNPVLHLKEIIDLKPHLAIVHAEAEGNFVNFAKVMHKFQIKVGVALLPKTQVEDIQPALEYIDHLLIFSGNLGSFGGTADAGLLAKAQAAKELKPQLEMGWDGGVNDQNAHLLAAGGIDVLNVGGFIQQASDPSDAYATLLALAG